MKLCHGSLVSTSAGGSHDAGMSLWQLISVQIHRLIETKVGDRERAKGLWPVTLQSFIYQWCSPTWKASWVESEIVAAFTRPCPQIISLSSFSFVLVSFSSPSSRPIFILKLCLFCSAPSESRGFLRRHLLPTNMPNSLQAQCEIRQTQIDWLTRSLTGCSSFNCSPSYFWWFSITDTRQAEIPML